MQSIPRTLAPLSRRAAAPFLVLAALGGLHRLLVIEAYGTEAYAPTYRAARGFSAPVDLLLRKGDLLLAGMAYELLFALIGAAGVALLPAARLRLAATVAAILGLGAYYGASVEHVAFNLSYINPGSIGLGLDPTFLAAQVTPTAIARTVAFWATGGLVLLLARLPRMGTLAGVGATASAVAVAVFVPGSFRVTESPVLQSHPLLPVLARAPAADLALDLDALRFTAASFGDAPAEARHNLLVIYLEGVSRHSLDKAEMTAFRALADRGIEMTRFLGTQLVTANGLHSTLTGQLPRMLSPRLRWDDPEGVHGPSLAGTLRAQGYRTAFLQSANLEYMDKDVHMRALGYDVLRGSEAWGEGRARGGWGVDDATLFDGILAHIDALPDDGRPWHVAALTSGTHAPFSALPAAFEPHLPSDRLRALRYLDGALADLIVGLEARGVLEDTVVILTADESRETSEVDDLAPDVVLNWLPMVALHPSGASFKLVEPVPATELPRLALALAGAAVPAPADLARPDPAPILFGNAILGRIFLYDPRRGDFLTCQSGGTLACEHRSGVADPLRPGRGVLEGVARYDALEARIAAHE